MSYLIFGLMIYAIFRSWSGLSGNAPYLEESAIPPAQLGILGIGLIGYLITAVLIFFPITMFQAITTPYPFFLLLLAPGILQGKRLSEALDTIGTDRAEAASKTIGNIMWLGLGIAAYAIFQIVVLTAFNML